MWGHASIKAAGLFDPMCDETVSQAMYCGPPHSDDRKIGLSTQGIDGDLLEKKYRRLRTDAAD
jgi:hypothetical protein